MREPVFEIVYVSEARRPMSTMELGMLLRASRERNHAAGITGMLLYAERSFLQVLEGPQNAVRQTLDRIALDDRHVRMFELLRGEQQGRSFAEWTMSFVDARPTTTLLAGRTDFLQGGWSKHPIADVRARTLSLVNDFRTGRLRKALEAAPRQSAIAMAAVRIVKPTG